MLTQPPKTPARGRVITLFLSTLLIFGSGLFLGRYVLPVQAQDNAGLLKFVNVENGQRGLVFPTFWEAWDKLHALYIEDVDDKDLFYGAVAGMVRATGDPYTVFSPPVQTKQFEENIQGSFSGVGVEIGVREGVVTVIAPLEGSPADKAGILAEDIILAIDGDPVTQDMTIDDVVSKIRGNNGEDVVLTVQHKSAGAPEDVKITRGKIEIESIETTIEDGIAHIRISNFNGDTSQRFTTAAREVLAADAQGIILDVRGNPGGFLQSAVEIASRFLPKGTLVVSEKGTKEEEYLAEGNTILEDIPTVVLVNGGSASASEILAGALMDQKRIPVVGTQTFGKGSVQEFIKLSDGSSLRVTIAKWFTPNGRSIDDEGIEPATVVEQNFETEEDEQLVRAREELVKLIHGEQSEGENSSS